MDFSGFGEDLQISGGDAAGKGCDQRDPRVCAKTEEQLGICGGGWESKMLATQENIDTCTEDAGDRGADLGKCT